MQDIETSDTSTIIMYSTKWCGDCRMAKRWFDTHNIAYTNIDIGEDEQAAEYVMRINGGMRSVPTIVFPDGSVLVEPSARTLAAKCLPEAQQEATFGARIKRLLQGQ